MDAALAALFHVLVFAYWLGGDLGAFAASYVVTDAKAPAPARLSAAKLLNLVDMAPRTALILTLPTGLTLAVARGWLALPPEALLGAWAFAVAWVALVWRLHHAAQASLRTIDLGVRIALLTGLTIAALGPWPLADFLRAKLLLLGAALIAGLAVRVLVRPLSGALPALAGAPTPEADAVIARALGRARIAVVCIWAALIAAAFLGLNRELPW